MIKTERRPFAADRHVIVSIIGAKKYAAIEISRARKAEKAESS